MDAQHQSAAAGARVAHIGEDPAFLRYPMRSFPSHLSIAANAGAALRCARRPLWNSRLQDSSARIEKRRKWAIGAGRNRCAPRPKARVRRDAPHISPEYLSRCVGEMAGPDGIVFNEYQLRLDACARTAPGTYFALSPAGGLGWSVGAALGAKLVAPIASWWPPSATAA